MTMTRTAMMLLVCTFAPAQAGGAFEAETTGVLSAKLTGQASYHVSSSGEVIIVLTAVTPSPLMVVVTRDIGGLPAAETSFALGSSECGDDEPDAPDKFGVSIRGGAPLTPSWIAAAYAGTLTLSPAAAGGVTGRFDLTACGENVMSGDRVDLKMRGTFRVGKSR